MKKLISFFVSLVVAVSAIASISVSAVWANSVKCTVYKEEMSGNNYSLFIYGTGHYNADTDSVTMYITNSSKREIDFQVCVGYAGSSVKTSVDSGFVTVKPGITAEFVLENLYDVPEKTNDELQYQPDSHLSEKSIVRISAQGAQEGDVFVISGMESYSKILNTYLKSFTTSSLEEVGTDINAVNSAKRVINEISEEDDVQFGTTMTQPEDETVIRFITVVCVSLILGIGGIAVYTVSYCLKKRKNNCLTKGNV